jgi:hypothetical protein
MITRENTSIACWTATGQRAPLPFGLPLTLINAHSWTPSVDTPEPASYLQDPGKLDLSQFVCTRHFHGRLNNVHSAESLNLPLHFIGNIEMGQNLGNSMIYGGKFLNVNGDYNHFSSSGAPRYFLSVLRLLQISYKPKIDNRMLASSSTEMWKDATTWTSYSRLLRTSSP